MLIEAAGVLAMTEGDSWSCMTFYAIPSPSPRRMARLLAKIDMGAGPKGCWPWTGSRSRDGYGRVRLADRLYNAHRVAFVWLGGGEPDAGACVLHACDEPACCNPAHLRFGTQRDNAADREQRGRGNHWSGPARSKIAKRIAKRGDAHWTHQKPGRVVRGERHASALLSEADVRAICASVETHAALARRYGVTEESIGDIRRGRSWAHLDLGARDRRVPGAGDNRRGPKPERSKLSADSVRAIRASTETNKALGERFGVSDVTISLIRRGKLRGEIV